MYLKIKKSSPLSGIVNPPSSKSQSIRALFFALLAKGESTLINILDSKDTEDAVQICKKLGASFKLEKNVLTLHSKGLPFKIDNLRLNSGNSGITTRFVIPLLGLRKNTEQAVVLDCGEQMRARPISSLVDSLRQLGLNIEFLNNEGSLPLVISGDLIGGSAEVSGITSQYLSALLLALPCARRDSIIRVRDLHERPYIEMTLDWLNRQNIHYTHHRSENLDTYIIRGRQKYKRFFTTIPMDFSSASYFIAAGVLFDGRIEVNGLNMQDPQGDKRLVDILIKMGGDIKIEAERLVVSGGKKLKGMKIDANDIPDLLPTLAVIGTRAMGKTEIINVKQARIKETDRIHSMTEGLKCLGANIDEYEDGMVIYPSQLQAAKLKGYGDHRTVMALSLAAMLAEGESEIDDAEAINKTFPKFIEMMRSLGANIEISNETS